MKLAFIGTGKIIEEALHAVEPVSGLERTAIYARPHSRAKAEAFAERYGIPEVWTDYADLLRSTEADAVYIGLVNSAHFPYAKEALLQGKHVLLEKPFTGFLAQAEELVSLARERGLFVLEAITVLHNDILPRMRDALPLLGPVRMVQANYSQYSSRYDSYIAGKVEHAFDPAYYGGALFDINIYNIAYCAELFGCPEEMRYFPNMGFSGVDTSGTLVLRYPGFTATCTGAKDSDSPSFFCVQGEQGWMRIDGKPNLAPALEICLTGHGGGTASFERVEAAASHHRMTQEFADFARIIDTGDAKAADRYMEASLRLMRLLEEARLSAGIEF